MNHGDAGFRKLLVVAGEAMRPREPRERALYNPTSRDGLEALWPLLQTLAPWLSPTVKRHLDLPASHTKETRCERPSVDPISPDKFEARRDGDWGDLDHLACSDGVVQAGGVHLGQEDKARGVGEKVPLSAKGLLACIEPIVRTAQAG